jgi:hypothetical protein
LTDLSVQSSTASGGGSLVYNDGSGVFTYTPPDLSSYITSLGDAIRDADFTTSGLMKRTGVGTYTSTTDNSSNWDTAFGWGNHASQGYLTQLPVHGLGVHTGVTLTNETAGDLLQYSGTQWVNWTPNYLTAETDTLQSVINRGNTVTGRDINFGEYVANSPKITYDDSDHLLWFKCQTVGSSSAKIWMGNGTSFNNLSIQQTQTQSEFITHNADLFLATYTSNKNIILQTAQNTFLQVDSYDAIKVLENGVNNGAGLSVELHWGSTNSAGNTGGKKLETTSTGVTVTGALTAGGLTYPTVNGTNGQVLTSDGAGNVAWGAGGGGGGASVTISDTPPAASAGDLWWESDSGRLKIYYQDVDSSQWVDVAPPLAPALSSNAPATASSTGSAGDIRYDSGYVYVCVATDTWKRAALTTW